MKQDRYEISALGISSAFIAISFFFKNNSILLWSSILLSIINMGIFVFFTFKREKITTVFVFLALAQLVIFFILFSSMSVSHYYHDLQPVHGEWIKFTAAHIIYALDFLDILNGYNINLFTKISAESYTVRIFLLAMYLMVNLFTLKIIFNQIASHDFMFPESRGMKGLRRFGLIAAFAAVSIYAWKHHWHMKTFISWLMDNTLFAIDFPDALQIFAWKLFPETGPIQAGIGLLFRFVVCAYIIAWGNKLYSRIIKITRPVEELAYISASPEYPPGERLEAVKRLEKYGTAAVSAIPQLIIALGDGSHRIRYAASDALEAIDPRWPEYKEAEKAVPFLIRSLKDSDKSVCMAALKTLGRMGGNAERAVSDIVKILRGDEIDMRQAAAEALAGIAYPAIPVLVRMVMRDEDMSGIALEILKQIDVYWQESEDAQREILRFAEMMTTQTGADRVSAIRALERIQPVSREIVPHMIQVLTDNAIRRSAINILGHIGNGAEQAIPGLIPILADGDETIRNLALKALENIQPDWRESEAAAKAVSLFIKCFTERGESLFEEPAEALAAIAYPAIPDLVKALIVTDKNLQSAASQALKKINPDWPQTKEALSMVSELSTALSNENWYIRNSAAQVLGSMGPGAIKAAPFLVKALSDSNRTVKASIKKALDKVMIKGHKDEDNGISEDEDSPWPPVETGREEVLKLVKDLADRDESIRKKSLECLENLEPPAIEAVPRLIYALADADRDVRAAACHALDKIDPEWRENKSLAYIVPLFINVMADAEAESPYIMPSEALMTIGAGAIQYLAALLADRNKALANTAFPILEKIDPEWPKSKGAVKAVPELTEKLTADEWYVRQAGAEILGKIGPAARKKALPFLVKGLADKNKSVRDAFKDAMDKVLLQ